MAEAVLFDIVAQMIMRLGSGTLKEVGLWWNVKKELRKLENTVSLIHPVLLDAEEQHLLNKQVKVWLTRMREAVLDADYLLDDFATEALRRRVMPGSRMTKEARLFFSHSNQLVYGYKMGCKIKKIREELDVIAADRQKFHLIERHTEMPFLSKRSDTHSFVREENVIGRDEDKMAIMETLLDSNVAENVLVIPVVGIGGLGKTTLAQFVYNDDQVMNHFELKMWVCVSNDFTLEGIIRKAIKSASSDLDRLQSEFRTEVEGKRYLLVLDDVWNDDLKKWLELKELLTGGARGSRIILTTRSKEVANLTSKMDPYELRGLSEAHSWSLFRKIVFNGEEMVNQHIREVGRRIVKKCAGVPLAIMTIGSLMYSKNPESQWSSFMENEFSDLPQKDNDILPILQLSYNHLPSPLKHCFAYCKLYPKGYEINVQTLIQHWIAHGFVKSSIPSQSLEDVGLEYFEVLLWRSFFQEAIMDKFGNATVCKMHDLMHDLATLVGDEGNVISNSHISQPINEKTRHVSLYFEDGLVAGSLDSLWPSLSKTNRVRTLLAPDGYGFDIKVEESHRILCDLKRLLVLEFQDLCVKTVPDSISRLKHLRYLNFSMNPISELPSSITKLLNLQTLKLYWCRNLKALPNDINKLVNLRCLDCSGCWNLTYMPKGLGKLTSLRKLPWFVVGKGKEDGSVGKHVGGLKEMKNLNSLRGQLSLRNLRNKRDGVVEFEAANLKEKQHLQSLTLDWLYAGKDQDVNEQSLDADYEEMSLQSLRPHPNLKELTVFHYGGGKFPSWLSSLTNLVELSLRDCGRCKCLPPIDQLLSLKILRIHGLANLEYIEESKNNNCLSNGSGQSSAFFPSLKELGLWDCPNLKGWKNGDNDAEIQTMRYQPIQFACLSSLQIRDCYKLIRMPLFPTLDEELQLFNVSKELLQQTIKTISLSPSPPTLKELCIHKCDDLESLSAEWLQNLTSLRKLRIELCRNLNCLSAGMRYLTSLRELAIVGCPQLKIRCENKEAADWSNIAHIPNIEIDGQMIQEERCYLLNIDQ